LSARGRENRRAQRSWVREMCGNAWIWICRAYGYGAEETGLNSLGVFSLRTVGCRNAGCCVYVYNIILCMQMFGGTSTRACVRHARTGPRGAEINIRGRCVCGACPERREVSGYLIRSRRPPFKLRVVEGPRKGALRSSTRFCREAAKEKDKIII